MFCLAGPLCQYLSERASEKVIGSWTVLLQHARRERGENGGKAAGSLLFVPGLHQVGKKFVLLLSLPFNTEFLSTQSENDEKIPLTEYRERAAGTDLCTICIFRAPSLSGRNLGAHKDSCGNFCWENFRMQLRAATNRVTPARVKLLYLPSIQSSH